MTEALQYGALGLLGVVLVGLGTGALRFGLPLLRSHLATAKEARELSAELRRVLPLMGLNLAELRRHADQLMGDDGLVLAIARDVHYLCGEVARRGANGELARIVRKAGEQ
jgi:hypothetical protein